MMAGSCFPLSEASPSFEGESLGSLARESRRLRFSLKGQSLFQWSPWQKKQPEGGPDFFSFWKPLENSPPRPPPVGLAPLGKSVILIWEVLSYLEPAVPPLKARPTSREFEEPAV